MLDFTTSSEKQYIGFGTRLMNECRDFHTHEQASQHIVSSIYHEFMSGDNPLLALVRIFRVVPIEHLLPNQRAQIAPEERHVLALTGTYGMMDRWCEREQSKNHQLIPLSPSSIHALTPMFEEILVKGMRVDLERLYETRDIMASTGRGGIGGILYVPDMMTSPLISTQKEFVQPYGIHSELGFGGLMQGLGGKICLYTLFAFTRVPVTQKEASRFMAMQPYIGTALASQDHHSTVFNT